MEASQRDTQGANDVLESLVRDPTPKRNAWIGPTSSIVSIAITAAAVTIAIVARPKGAPHVAPAPSGEGTRPLLRNPVSAEATETESQELVQVAHELQQQSSAQRQNPAANQNRTEAVQLWLKGLEQLRGGNPQAARALLERAIAQSSDIAGIHSALGRARANLGDWEGSRESYDRALALDPKDIGALLGMATIEIFHDSNLDSAKRLVQRALAVNSQSELAKNRMRAIEQLLGEASRKR